MFSILQVRRWRYVIARNPWQLFADMAQLEAHKFLKRYIRRGGLLWTEEHDAELNLRGGDIWVATTNLYTELCLREGENMRIVVREITDLLNAAVGSLPLMLPDNYRWIVEFWIRATKPLLDLRWIFTTWAALLREEDMSDCVKVSWLEEHQDPVDRVPKIKAGYSHFTRFRENLDGGNLFALSDRHRLGLWRILANQFCIILLCTSPWMHDEPYRGDLQSIREDTVQNFLPLKETESPFKYIPLRTILKVSFGWTLLSHFLDLGTRSNETLREIDSWITGGPASGGCNCVERSPFSR